VKNKQKIILDIVPLTKIPLSRGQSFSYLAEKKIKPGTLVLVPLFKRLVEGVVIGNRPDFLRVGNIELKKINSVLEENFLNAKQLELAGFISEYFISPLGIVLKNFVPKRVTARSSKPAIGNFAPKNDKTIILTVEQQKAVDQIISAKPKKSQDSGYYLFGPSGSGKTEVYIRAILKLLKKEKDSQFLILLPELTLTSQAIERYGSYFRKNEIAILNSGISKGKFYANWSKIKSGEAQIIIGSRMAVFAPFKKLKLIIVDEEQDISFKQWDMNPRYDARVAAEKLAALHQTRIIFGSATPSIENFYRAINKSLHLLELPDLSLPGKWQFSRPEVTVVDMRKERWTKNFSSVSKKLQSEITYALKNKLQIIIFVNRQGMSNFSICLNCKNVLACPKCDRSLIYETSGFYRCPHCSYKTSITPQCPKCKGLNFSNIGVGTQKVEREISRFFPEARIIRADGQTMKNAGAREKIYKDFSEGKADILIGTQMISKGWDLPSLSLVGIIDADNMLSIPDFRANIRAYQNIVQASGRSGRPGAKFRGNVIIQTFNPEQFIIKAAAERDFHALYEKEIRERNELQMPPFGKFIKLIFQDPSLKKTETEAQKIFQMLMEKGNRFVKIYEPRVPLLSKIRGSFRKQILIKFTKMDQQIDPEIRKLLGNLPVGWSVDIDPISII